MTALTTLIRTETKLTTRDPMAIGFGLVFPALLLVVIGLAFPGAREPSDDLGGARLVDVYGPVVLALGIATAAFSVLPASLAQYRERGVLRRMATTPIHPGRMVAAQLVVQLVVACLAAAVVVVAGVVVLGIDPPAHAPGFAVVFVLAAVSMLAIGLLVGTLAPSAGAGQALGMAVFFPILFFSGVYFPRESMPDGLRTVSDLTPAGAAVQALADTWAGAMPSLGSVVVMAVYAVVAGLLATRFFRWE